MSRSRNKRRRTKQSAAQQVQQAAVPAPETIEPVTGFDPDYPFADVGGYEQGEVVERQLMLLVKDWRKGRATRSILSMLTDGYVAVFSIVIIAAMIVSAIRSAQNQAAGCTTEGCSTARELIGWLVLAACWVAVLAASRVFGPVIASAAASGSPVATASRIAECSSIANEASLTCVPRVWRIRCTLNDNEFTALLR